MSPFPHRPAARRWRALWAATLVAAALFTPIPSAGQSWEPLRAEQPQPSVPLPVAVDAPSPYQGQKHCDPIDKEGVKALRELLLSTYGPATVGLSRGCASSTSEHFDGRALDWMRSTRVPEQAAQVAEFLSWLLAPAPDGTPQEMARRLGLMYVIWDNRMIRMYDPGRGWTQYKGCLTAAKSSAGLDTACHRDHLHISMSWAGAAKLTSWWSGRALGPGYIAASATGDTAASATAATDGSAETAGRSTVARAAALAMLAAPGRLSARASGDSLVVTWRAPRDAAAWPVTGYGMTVRVRAPDGPLVGSCTATARARVCFAGDLPRRKLLWVAVAALTHRGPGRVARITARLD